MYIADIYVTDLKKCVYIDVSNKVNENTLIIEID